VRLRLHVFFLLFAAFTIYLSWLESRHAPGNLLWVGFLSLAVLLASVLLHELGHCWAALRMGGRVREVVIGPLGGLAPVQVPSQPQYELVASMAGPAVNLAVCVICAPLLLAAGESNPFALLHPLQPANLTEGSTWAVGVKLFFWINWLLVLINLVPAFPLDGGRALRAMVSILWPVMGPRRASLAVTRTARIVAVGLLVAAYLVYDGPSTGLAPAWFALVLLAVFLFFGAKQEEAYPAEEDVERTDFGFDFSEGYSGLEPEDDLAEEDPEGPFSRWLRHRREAGHERQQEIEIEEEARVDGILARLHKSGMKSLSSEERAILQRVSARYRSRLKQ